MPPQRLWQTQLAIGREEGRHGAPWNHPFWVVDKQAWIEARHLKAGDKVLLSSGKEVAISGTRSYNVEATKVYNFEVADNHTYFVGEDGVLVHNYEVSLIARPNGYKISARLGERDLHLFNQSGDEAILVNTDRAKMDQAAINIYKQLYNVDTTSNPDGSISVKSISRETAKRRMDEIMDHLAPSVRFGGTKYIEYDKDRPIDIEKSNKINNILRNYLTPEKRNILRKEESSPPPPLKPLTIENLTKGN